MKRSFIAGIVVCLLPLVSCVAEVKPRHPDETVVVSPKHLWTVVGNSAMVANPEYRFLMGDELEPAPGGYEFRFVGTAPKPNDGQPVSFESPFTALITMSGDVRNVSKLRSTSLSPAIAEFGSGVRNVRPENLPREFERGTMATALIEFDKPETEKSLGLEDGPSEDVFLSRQRPGARPIYWSSQAGCSSNGLPDPCIDYSSVSQFRSWVSQLTAADGRILGRFALNLADLQRAAADGLIYGIIVDVSPYGLRQRLKRGNIRAVWVAEVRACPIKKECP
ncbi:hypothetical protein [Nonomuraea sp. NPDC049480]|uniref:hypothetical protein n=1 Tax=Nonomuraea sp. NPDC049480 TaxID=3364353 RepID=UPI003789D3DF